MSSSTALAYPNIAFIKYWGNRDANLRLPANGSISMNLGGLRTCTTVTFDPSLKDDELSVDGVSMTGHPYERVTATLRRVRELSGVQQYARVESENNFPVGVGIASSASAFAALALAASSAAGLDLSEPELSRLARRGSGSACRSIPEGFVEWHAGTGEEDSYAVSLAPPDHWDLADCIAVVSSEHKAVGSTRGHALAATSPLQSARVADAPRRLDLCRRAILDRDFDALAAISELDSNLMHAVMLTSNPPLYYWLPTTVALMKSIPDWRASGLPCCFTIDAGPNVHVICRAHDVDDVSARLSEIEGVDRVITAVPGGPARLV